jgi:hypothetical protein
MTIVRTRGNAPRVITRADAARVGLATCSAGGSGVDAWTVKGDWDGSTNVFPNTSVLKGYQYFNTANSTTLLMGDGGIIPAGAIIVANVDNPGQTVANWYFILSVIGDLSNWILNSGSWVDTGIWEDTSNWID